MCTSKWRDFLEIYTAKEGKDGREFLKKIFISVCVCVHVYVCACVMCKRAQVPMEAGGIKSPWHWSYR